MARTTNLMNTKPKAKTILCYGDSNTWGRLPDRSGRYDAKTRWTGRLQDLLGDDYYVIEEGLGGRTTDLDDPDSVKNGLTYLVPCIKSHEPLDYIVIMLGTNDFKFRFDRTAEDVAKAVEKLITITKEVTNAKIILVSPVAINPQAPRFMEFYNDHFDLHAGEESSRLGDLLQAFATKHEYAYLDASKVADVGEDGLHLTLTSHEKLSRSIFDLVR